MQDRAAVASPAAASLDDAHRGTFRSNWFRLVAWSLFWLVTLWGASSGLSLIVKDTPHAMHDFVAPYSGAGCLLLGCDPYDPAQVLQTFTAAGGDNNDLSEQWSNTPPVYPPSTLIELLPFTFLNYHRARIVWYLLSTLAFIVPFLLWAGMLAPPYRPWMALLGALLRESYAAAFAAEAGQTSFIALGLAVIALWCLIRRRYVVAGMICLGAGIGLKPQLAGIVVLYLILRPVFRGFAIRAAVIALALVVIGGVWVSLPAPSKKWWTELSQQAKMSQQPGAVNDPSTANRYAPDIVNAQAASVLLTPDPSTYNLLAYLLFAGLLIPFVIKAGRGADTNTQMFSALAAIACIGILPVYHRVYDLLILLLTFPSLICLFVQHRKLRWVAALATFVALIPASMVGRFPRLVAFNFVWHFQSLAVIALAVTWLAALYVCDEECEGLYAQLTVGFSSM